MADPPRRTHDVALWKKRGENMPDTVAKLYKICEGLNKRFPGNEDPFRILSRLMEECGEPWFTACRLCQSWPG